LIVDLGKVQDLSNLKVEYTMTVRGKLQLIINGYTFIRKEARKNRVYWTCNERGSIKCPAKVTQDAKTGKLIIAKNMTHTHEIRKERRKGGTKINIFLKFKQSLNYGNIKINFSCLLFRGANGTSKAVRI
jgi:hypothetical protein